MILYEFEGKKLLKSAGINIPNSLLISSQDEKLILTPPLVLKAQVLSGKRADAGGIKIVGSLGQAEECLKQLFGKIINKEKVEKILLEEKIDFDREYYLSIFYDTDSRSPVLSLSSQGGLGIEEREVKTFKVDILDPIASLQDDRLGVDKEILEKAIRLFFDQDCLLLEINPLIKDKNNNWLALDAKIKLDDTVLKRHIDWQFPQRGVPGYTPSENEIKAKKIDEEDYRGTAGSTYFDFDGDIAILASGGGASLTAMDALIKFGGKPANFTEYSGNPPKEKVEKLTEIVLSKHGLNGLWVIGAIANFTDIYETLSGFLQALKKINPKPRYPIVIRRGGPRDSEAFEMLKEETGFDFHLYGQETSISQSAKIMIDLAKKYKGY